MKKLLIVLLILSPFVMAKSYQKVQILEENKKGWGKVIYKIGDFCFSIVVGAVSNR
jgi:hypothetical protein